jgi:hypothetical protein
VSPPNDPRMWRQLLARVHCEDLAFVEERYMEDPAAWCDEWPENPPIYEAAM